MNKVILKCFLGLALLISNQANSGTNSPLISSLLKLTPFTQAAFDEVKGQYQGKKWLTLLWSVDCPPCMKELALIQKLQQKQHHIAVVIINVDTHEGSAQQRNETLMHFDLVKLKHFHFQEGLEDQNRYQIDPQWFGELPRSYFIDEKGTFHGKSGLVSKDLLEKWLLPPKLVTSSL